MSEVAISALPPASSANPADIFPIVQGGVTKQLPISAIINSAIDNSVSHLKSLPAAPIQGVVYNVVSFYDGWAAVATPPVGGGPLVFDTTLSKSNHNGVTHYSPESLTAWAGTKSDIGTLLNWTGSGSGLWVRLGVCKINPEMAGADGGANDSPSYQSAINYCISSKLPLIASSDTSLENITISGSVSIESSFNTIRMVSGSSQRRIFHVTSGTLTLKNMIVNAADGSVGNSCVLVEGGAINANWCKFTGARQISGYGEGVMIFTSALKSSFGNCLFYNNGGDGLTVYDATGVTVSQCESYSNGYGGMIFNNQTLPVGAKKISNVTISDSNCYNNGRSGFGFGNPYNDHNTSGDNFGHANKTCEDVKMSNCSSYGNSNYGVVISCYGGQFSNISSYDNDFGGMLVNGIYVTIDNPTIKNNGQYGVDIGFGSNVNITGGEIAFNSASANAGGLLLEACIKVNVSGTKVYGNGPTTTGWNVIIAGVGGTGDGRYFPAVANQITLNCEVDCSDSRNGMRVDDAAESVIDNNAYKGTDPLKYTRYATHTGELNNSGATAKRAYYSANPASNVLVIPDVIHNVLTNSTDTINSVRPYSWDFFRGKIPYIRVSAQGSGYNAATTTVTITGDGTGAAGTAFVNGGKVIGIRMTNFGSGYTTATAVISGGGGSGATLVAQVGMPLLSSARATICHNQAGSFVLAGPPVINTPLTPTNLTAPNRGALTLIERYGQWIVESSNYGM